jgi:hypothetical protein
VDHAPEDEAAERIIDRSSSPGIGL